VICLIACIFYGQTAYGQVYADDHQGGVFLQRKYVKKSIYREGHEEHDGLEGHQVTGVHYRMDLTNSINHAAGISLVPADSLHRGRFWTATGVTAALYTGSVIALNAAWYKQYPRSSFHFFDDTGEWRYMDKTGHLYTSYFESLWGYNVARWTGMSEKTSSWTGAAMGLFFQGTVEVLDGFSEEWGFSLADMGFNILGSGIFLTQQRLWGEQRIHLKVSSTPMKYSSAPITATNGEDISSLQRRVDDLFGSGYAERFLKDYNAQTTWLSINVHSFLNPESRFPRWLNIAVGYGAENMFGGFGNTWTEGDAQFVLTHEDYPRYSQFYLSPDIDFSRIPTRSPFLRMLLGMLNVFKMPGPVLEVSGEKGMRLNLRW